MARVARRRWVRRPPTYAFVLEPLLRPRITRYDITPRRWPAGLNLTIAALADIHACRPWMSPERIRSIVETTNALGADMIVLLGDYVTGHRYVASSRSIPSEWSKALAALRAPLGVHAILGNHEWWDDRAAQRDRRRAHVSAGMALEAVGIPVYENDAVRLDKAGRAVLAGRARRSACLPAVAAPLSRPPHRHRRSRRDAGKVTDDAPGRSCWRTSPTSPCACRSGSSLMLSGHTHGGQVRLFGWSPVVPSRYGNRFAYGHVREHCDLIVSGGLGCSIMPVRFGVPPEIVLGVASTGALTHRDGRSPAGSDRDSHAEDTTKAAAIAAGALPRDRRSRRASPTAIARSAARRAFCI